MKCPICNAENVPDARSCEKCGFSLGLGQVQWPDLSALRFPDQVEMPESSQMAQVNPTPAVSRFARPSAPAVDETRQEPVPQVALPSGEAPGDVAEVVRVDAPVPQQQPSDDDLAREHIARGIEALKERLLDQAQWEFEQARDLAGREDIVRIAQSQLDALRTKAAALVTPERLRPIRKPAPAPISAPSLPQIDGGALGSALRAGLFAGLVAGFIVAITGSAALCLGFLLGPAAGFVAGWSASGPNRRPGDVLLAVIAGGAAGLGVAIGQWIGYPASTSSSSRATVESLQALSCVMGFFYIALAAGASVLGSRVRRQQK